MADLERTSLEREGEEEEEAFAFEGFRETFLAHLGPGESAAAREVGRMLDHYAKEPREGQDAPWAPLPYLEFLGVAKDLRYLKRYLEEIAIILFESDEPDDERSRQWQAFARSRGGELGKLAEEFEARVEEMKEQGLVEDDVAEE